MCLRTTIRFAIATAAAAASLAGCAAHGSQLAPIGDPAGNGAQSLGRSPVRYSSGLVREYAPPATNGTARSWMKRFDGHRPLTYVADFFADSVSVLDRGANLVGFIGNLSSPNGLFVDANRNLWVANEYGNDVLEFARGATSPKATLADPNEYPVDVTICANGTTYVSNLFDAGPSGTGSISVYAPGSTSPTGALTYPGQDWNYFVTRDAAGNVFTTLIGPDAIPAVVEYPGGSQSAAKNLQIPLQFPGGIKMDPAGNLLVNDQQARTVTEYTEAGAPTGKSITYGNIANDWVDIAVTRNASVVAGADAYLAQATADTFPSGTQRQVYYVPTGPGGNMPYGIAFDPGQQ